MSRYRNLPKEDELPYRLLQGLSILLGVFCTAVLIFIAMNFAQGHHVDPLENESFQKLRAYARANPDDQEVIDYAVQVDKQIRDAFYENKTFRRTGAWLLFLGMIAFLAAYRGLASFKKREPYPGADPVRDEIGDKRRGRIAVTVFSMALILFCGIYLIASDSRFNRNKVQDYLKMKEEAKYKVAEAPSLEAMRKQWPSFRGSLGQSITSASNVPMDWDSVSGKNIRWKVPIKISAFNSPVIWDDLVFFSASDESGRYIYALNKETGKESWVYHHASVLPMPTVTPDTGHAAPTLVTDGRFVVGIFSTGEVISVNMEGKEIWKKELGQPENHYGHSSSLLAWEDSLFIQFDKGQGGEVLALNIVDGSELWRTSRDVMISWASPTLSLGESPRLYLVSDPSLEAFDLTDGSQIWRTENAIYGEVGASPAVDAQKGIVYVANEYAKLAAVDATSGEELWYWEEALPEASSPLAKDGLLILPTSGGIVTCLHGETGEVHWQKEFDYGFYSSPILVEDRVYLTDMKGNTHIFAFSKDYQEIGRGALNESVVSTPAVVEGRLIIRGNEHIFCVGGI